MVCLPFFVVSAVLVSTAKLFQHPWFSTLLIIIDWPDMCEQDAFLHPLLYSHFTAFKLPFHQQDSSLGKQIWPFFFFLNLWILRESLPGQTLVRISELFSSKPHCRNWLHGSREAVAAASAEHCERTPYYIYYIPLPCKKTKLQNRKQKSQFCMLVSKHCKVIECTDQGLGL